MQKLGINHLYMSLSGSKSKKIHMLPFVKLWKYFLTYRISIEGILRLAFRRELAILLFMIKYDLTQEIHVIIHSKGLQSFQIFYKNLKIEVYKIINLSVILYGCEAWSPKLTEERRLKIFEKTSLKRILGHRRDENETWRKFHSEELHSFYRSMVKYIRLRGQGL